MNKSYIKLLLSKVMLVCLFIMIFASMLVAPHVTFFISLKILLILSIVSIVIYNKKIKDFFNLKHARHIIFLIPCVYGLVVGFINGNPGVGREVVLYLYASITYLIIFNALADQDDSLLIIEIAVKVSSVFMVFIFYYLFFFRSKRISYFFSRNC